MIIRIMILIILLSLLLFTMLSQRLIVADRTILFTFIASHMRSFDCGQIIKKKRSPKCKNIRFKMDKNLPLRKRKRHVRRGQCPRHTIQMLLN